jgi:hypothetical protein
MTFKTAAELNISQAEHDALAALIPYLQGQVCTLPSRDASTLGSHSESAICNLDLETELGFHMNFGAALAKQKLYDCGCVACIGGHVSLRMQGLEYGQKRFTGPQLKRADQYVMSLDPREEGSYGGLAGLYYPNDSIYSDDWDKIRPDLASQAITNFLTTGDAQWRSIAEANGLRTVDSMEDQDA